jgi:hypothetical protein
LKHFLVTLIGLSVAACGASRGTEPGAVPGVATSPAPAAKPAGTLLENYLRDAREAWKTKDRARLADLYTKDARITEIGKEERKFDDMLDDMFDGPFEVSFSRGLLNGHDAVVEWVYGGLHPARRRIAVRGASVLSFSADGRVEREVRYYDESTSSAQIVAGFRHCLPHREAVPDATTAPTLHIGSAQDSDAPARAWLGSAGSSAKASPAIPVANMFLAADGPGVSGMAADLAHAFKDVTTKVGRCVSSPDLVACEVERRGTFSAPLIGIKPTGRTGTTHWLEVAELSDGNTVAVTAYGSGQEFARAFVDLDSNGFLTPAQMVDPDPCK